MKDYQVMPELAPEEYEALKADIEARGVQVPIEFDTEGNCIDGHHRLKICKELGITDYPKIVRVYATEEEKFTQARALNMTRRHLSRDQRRKLIKEQIKATPEKSDRQIAIELGVSHPTVGAIRRELEEAGDVEKITTSKDTIGREQPRKREKNISVFNPTEKEADALKDPDIQRRLAENDKLNLEGAMYEQAADRSKELLEDSNRLANIAALGVYDVVIVDPPARMSLEDVRKIHIPAAKDCHVFLWTDSGNLPEGFETLRAWNVKPVLEFVCDRSEEEREKIEGTPIIDTAWFILYGHIGNPQFVDEKKFFAFIDGGKDEFYKMIRRVTAGRRLEMYTGRNDEGFEEADP